MEVSRRKAPPRPPRPAAPLPLLAYLLALAAPGRGADEPVWRAEQTIGAIAVSRADGVFVASGSCLDQLDYSLEHRLSRLYRDQAGNCTEPVSLAPPARPRPGSSFSKLLLPYREGATGLGGLLLTGWTFDRGACEVRPLGNLSLSSLHNGTEVVSCHPQGSTAGVVYRAGQLWYLAVAATYALPETETANRCNPAASDRDTAISIKNTEGRSFDTKEEGSLKRRDGGAGSLHFVDAFLWNASVYFPYYPYNYTSGDATGWPSMARIAQSDEVKFQGQVALDCGHGHPYGRRLLLSSSLVEALDVWAGVFSAATGEGQEKRSPATTALCLFRMREIQARAKNCQWDFLPQQTNCKEDQPEKVQPIASSTMIHSDLTSVYGTVVMNRAVLFLGTGDGQLLKVILGENLTSNCPEVIYEIKEETPVFYKLVPHPEKNSYIYLTAGKEVRRVRVANCNKHKSCSECLTAADPHCGWCHSLQRCTFKDDCVHSDNSENWLDISSGAKMCPQIHISQRSKDKITVTLVGSISPRHSGCVVKNVDTGRELCKSAPNESCTCSLLTAASYKDVLVVDVTFSFGSWHLSKRFNFTNCSSLRECPACIGTGCAWCKSERKCIHPFTACSPSDYDRNQEPCQVAVEKPAPSKTAGGGGFKGNKTNRTNQGRQVFSVKSIEPQKISTLGKSNVIVTGANFTQASDTIVMILKGTSTCDKDVVRVSHVLNDTHMKFSLPSSRKEMKDVCIQFDDGNCSSVGSLSYIALPRCSLIYPATTWTSGGQNITIMGRNFDVIDNLIISHELKGNINVSEQCVATYCSFLAPSLKSSKVRTNVTVKLKVQETYLDCGSLQYLEDPRFTGYRVDPEVDTELEVKILKENDNFNISKKDIEITLFHGENKQLNCSFENITRNQDLTTILCKIKGIRAASSIASSSKKIHVKLGNLELDVEKESVASPLYFLIGLPILLVIVIFVAVGVTRHKSKELSRKQSQQLELLESELRKEIRDGFAELQMDKLDVVDSFGTVPFLDYKHFALRTFFPENRDANDKNERLTALDALICNKSFLVTVIHTLEKQKNFSVKDRCLFASFLTIALQTKLVYLTSILEVLTRDLMEQSSNMQPKLMLRRTESVVEKLLTNWMSVCLSGFLRETVGEPFYLLVTTLNQKINKGPVDVITCKALYTLNEDWLLWQVPEFSTVAQVDEGVPLKICLSQFCKWIQKIQQQKKIIFATGVSDLPTSEVKLCAFVTWSDWDLGVCLEYECKRKQLFKPVFLNAWIDLRVTYKIFYRRKPKGLSGALQEVGIEFLGREHSGLDDSRNTALLAWKMIRDGCLMKITRSWNKVPTKKNPNILGRNLNTNQVEETSVCNRSSRGPSICDREPKNTIHYHEKVQMRSDGMNSIKVNQDELQPKSNLKVGLRNVKNCFSLLTTQSSTSLGQLQCPSVCAPMQKQIKDEHQAFRAKSKASTADSDLVLVSTTISSVNHVSDVEMSSALDCLPMLTDWEDVALLPASQPEQNIDDMPLISDSNLATSLKSGERLMVLKESELLSYENFESTEETPQQSETSKLVVYKSPHTTIYNVKEAKDPRSDVSNFKLPECKSSSLNSVKASVSYPSVLGKCLLLGGTKRNPPSPPTVPLAKKQPFTIHEEKPTSCDSSPVRSRKLLSSVFTPTVNLREPWKSGKVTPPLCRCGRRSKRLVVSNNGPNHGKVFYCCPIGKYQENRKCCGYFKWEQTLQKERANSTIWSHSSGALTSSSPEISHVCDQKALNVIFEKIPENDSADVCRNISVNVLDCDTIGQAKEKIFQAFLSKNGSPYGLQLNEICLELQVGTRQKELLDIDGSSVILEDGITKLNTIGHYEISNGSTIKVFKKIANFTSDVEYSDDHCHLILPDSEAFQDVQGKRHRGKHKFKVKEMYLTKLLSTKVAIHSVLEKLFRSIWSLPNSRAPFAIKYFFDFLDAQAENKKITDPDVVHIWKTNSLPLRFWVNILKNPQFVFDIKKTPHIDGCLSVIAQAFMDAFSLTEQQLGKEAPTNKLLYAKDIPTYKEEVKSYYKAIRDLPPLSPSEMEEFLTQESKKHENEFNEEVALTEIYKYIVKYFDEILNKLERERGLEEAQKQLLHVKVLFDEKKKCKWM